jgi:predicted lipoprotein
MDEKKTLYERIKQLDKQVRWLTKGEKQMKIEMVGDIVEQPDGSGQVELDVDAEGAQYLMQLGFEVLLRRGMDSMEHDKEQYERNR